MRRGFTLIELLVVLLIAGLLAGGAALKLTSTLQQRTMEDIADRVRQLDAMARLNARQDGHAVQLVVNLGQQILALQNADKPITPPTGMGHVRLSEVRLSGRRFSEGEVKIGFSRDGLSPSYAVLLEDRQERKRWLVFVGFSGAYRECKDESEMLRILSLEQKRDDAD